MPRRSDAVVQIRSDRNAYHGNAYTNYAANIVSNADCNKSKCLHLNTIKISHQ